MTPPCIVATIVGIVTSITRQTTSALTEGEKTMKEKLIELITEALQRQKGTAKVVADYGTKKIADHLISKGLIIPVKCKNCRHWKYDAGKMCGRCASLLCYTSDYFWCFFGERKDESDC